MGPTFFKIIKTELQTCPNMWFWPKTELWTSQTSPKFRTVREYRTVCSTSNFSTFFHCRKCLISNRVYIGTITTIALRTTKSALKAFNGIVTLAESNCCVYLGWNSRWPYKNESLLGKLLGHGTLAAEPA